jgi:shikimate dehydrogenase
MPCESSHISGATRVVGVCGHGIAYTLSPAMHNAAFRATGLDYVYVTFEVAPGTAADAVAGIRALGLAGVNITKPLKTEMIPYLDALTEAARRVGSVNTVIRRDTALVGDTTDGVGLRRALEGLDVRLPGKTVLILGAGGAARAACDMSASAGAGRTVVAARNREKAEETASVGRAEVVSLDPSELAEAIRSADLVVNAIPSDIPVEAAWFGRHQLVYDTRYDVADTPLMRCARMAGARVSNGLDMLLFQGAAAFELWTGHTAPVEVMRTALIEGLKQRQG